MENLKKSITKGITTINVKTNNMLEQNKCKTYIATLEKEIEELTLKAGKALFQNWESGNFSAEGLETIMDDISGKYQIIKEQEDYIRQLQEEEQKILGNEHIPASGVEDGVVFCCMCGAKNRAEYKFCVKCGASMKE